MRVLFLHHLPLDEQPVGPLLRRWAVALLSSGNQVQAIVGDQRAADDPAFDDPGFAVQRIVCRGGDDKADVPIALPDFSSAPEGEGRTQFLALSDVQLALYRDRWRRRLDVSIDQFDPHVVHVQHIWLAAQLALETGVPYLLNGWPAELVDCRDERYRVLAEQAAENATQIL